MNRMRKKLYYDEHLLQFIQSSQHDFYRLAHSYCKNEQDAMDIVQDSIQKAMQAYGQLEDKEKLKSWFYKIVVRTSLDFLRKHKKWQVMEDEKLASIQMNHNDQYENTDLQYAMDDLPMMYKQIIILRYFEDLKIEAIAFILDENVNTIKTRLYKGLRLLRADMKEEGAINYEK